MPVDALRNAIRTVPNFPKEGIIFRDITPILRDPQLTRLAVEALAHPFENQGVEIVLGVEARGFLFGPMIAQHLNAAFIPARKQGRLPRATIAESYSLEYGENVIEVHEEDIQKGDSVLIHDDLVATGGTAAAMQQLAKVQGAIIAGFTFLVELAALNGRSALGSNRVHAVISYD